MEHPYFQAVLKSFYDNWEMLEKILLLPSKLPEFSEFLSHYRGQPVSKRTPSRPREELGKQVASLFLQFFMTTFTEANVEERPHAELKTILAEAEKHINLAFYCWFGLNDQNYQLRTVVHFFEIEGAQALFANDEGVEFAIVLTENGMCFRAVGDEYEARRLPISKMCGYLSLPSLNFEDTAALLSQARIIQREICLMTNEWEYLNSILAVEFGNISNVVLKNKTPEMQDKFAGLLKKMDQRRNALAHWCLESLCDFQEGLLLFQGKVVSSDVSAENEAISALILAALQKIFLPASVSRLQYGSDIVRLFQRFAQLRARQCSEDMASQFLLQVTQSARGDDFSPLLFQVLRLKPFEWKLSFEPAAALKSFTWSYSHTHHLLLCALFAVCYFKKLTPALASEAHLSEIASCLQMQDHVMGEGQAPVQPMSIASSEIQNLMRELMSCLDKQVKKTKATEELVAFIKQHLSDLLQGESHA